MMLLGKFSLLLMTKILKIILDLVTLGTMSLLIFLQLLKYTR